MNSTALVMMLATMMVVTAFTAYFFYKVLKAPVHRHEHKSLPDPADFGQHEM